MTGSKEGGIATEGNNKVLRITVIDHIPEMRWKKVQNENVID